MPIFTWNEYTGNTPLITNHINTSQKTFKLKVEQCIFAVIERSDKLNRNKALFSHNKNQNVVSLHRD